MLKILVSSEAAVYCFQKVTHLVPRCLTYLSAQGISETKKGLFIDGVPKLLTPLVTKMV